LIVVLDTGGVEGLAPIDERRRARLRALRQEAQDIVVPAAVLAEGLFTGRLAHDHHVRRLLSAARVAATDEPVGYAAGALRQASIAAGLRPPPSAVDAVVAAEADARAGREEVRIVTTDADDLEALASLTANAGGISVLGL
jgi:hypothetical protein